MKTTPLVLLALVGLFSTRPSAAHAQTAQDLVGTWTLVSLTHEENGTTTDLYGPNPKGLLVFDATGHFSWVVVRSDLPKFASNNRTTGTAEENQAVVEGSLAFFGTYTVDEAAKTFLWHVDASTFPNWTGTDQKRPFTLSGDELTYVTPVASTGTGTNQSVWKRVPLAGGLGAIAPASAQQSPPESEQAKQVVALVEKAAALIDSHGKSIFPEFRNAGSEWRTGDTYLFVDDLKEGVNVFNAGFPQREGTELSKEKDSNGKLFAAEFVKVVQSKGAGWVDYMFPKPGQSQPSQKWSYVKAVTIDGTPGLVGAGFYPQ